MYENCKKIGITGGIGSGKTTVAAIFGHMGIPIYVSDVEAKRLQESSKPLVLATKKLLGEAAYTPEGKLNRAYIANMVFNDATLLAQLNSLVHPAVERHYLSWHKRQAKKGVPYTLKESALLVEIKGYEKLDALVVVTAPETLRLARTMLRDHLDEVAVHARMSKQSTDSEKLKYADYVIVNDGMNALIPQAWAIHQALTR